MEDLSFFGSGNTLGMTATPRWNVHDPVPRSIQLDSYKAYTLTLLSVDLLDDCGDLTGEDDDDEDDGEDVVAFESSPLDSAGIGPMMSGEDDRPARRLGDRLRPVSPFCSSAIMAPESGGLLLLVFLVGLMESGGLAERCRWREPFASSCVSRSNDGDRDDPTARRGCLRGGEAEDLGELGEMGEFERFMLVDVRFFDKIALCDGLKGLPSLLVVMSCRAEAAEAVAWAMVRLRNSMFWAEFGEDDDAMPAGGVAGGSRRLPGISPLLSTPSAVLSDSLAGLFAFGDLDDDIIFVEAFWALLSSVGDVSMDVTDTAGDDAWFEALRASSSMSSCVMYPPPTDAALSSFSPTTSALSATASTVGSATFCGWSAASWVMSNASHSRVVIR